MQVLDAYTHARTTHPYEEPHHAHRSPVLGEELVGQHDERVVVAERQLLGSHLDEGLEPHGAQYEAQTQPHEPRQLAAHRVQRLQAQASTFIENIYDVKQTTIQIAHIYLCMTFRVLSRAHICRCTREWHTLHV